MKRSVMNSAGVCRLHTALKAASIGPSTSFVRKFVGSAANLSALRGGPLSRTANHGGGISTLLNCPPGRGSVTRAPKPTYQLVCWCAESWV